MINKRKLRKINDKKILHKIGKHWVVMSTAILGAIGIGAVSANNPVHADDAGGNVNATQQAAPTDVMSNNTDTKAQSSTSQSAQPSSMAGQSSTADSSNNTAQSSASTSSSAEPSSDYSVAADNLQTADNNVNNSGSASASHGSASANNINENAQQSGSNSSDSGNGCTEDKPATEQSVTDDVSSTYIDYIFANSIVSSNLVSGSMPQAQASVKADLPSDYSLVDSQGQYLPRGQFAHYEVNVAQANEDSLNSSVLHSNNQNVTDTLNYYDYMENMEQNIPVTNKKGYVLDVGSNPIGLQKGYEPVNVAQQVTLNGHKHTIFVMKSPGQQSSTNGTVSANSSNNKGDNQQNGQKNNQQNNQPQNGKAAPITVTYTDQAGHTFVSNINGNVGQSGNDVTKLAAIPQGYTLNNGQNISYDFQSNPQKVNLNVTGKQVSGNVTVTIHKDDGNQDTTQTKTVNGRVGDSYTINPSDFAPSNFKSQSSPLQGQFTANGVDKDAVTFNYSQEKGAAVTVNYINQDNNSIATNTMTGNVGAQNSIPTPDGYTINSGQPTTATIGDNPQNLTVHVTGKDASTLSDHTVHLTLIEKGSKGSVIKTDNVPVDISNGKKVGDSYTINPSNYLPKGFTTKDQVLTGMINANGLSNDSATFTYNDANAKLYKFNLKIVTSYGKGNRSGMLSKVVPIYVNNLNGNSFTINPSDSDVIKNIPDYVGNFTPDNDKSVNGTIGKNGLSVNNATFSYNATSDNLKNAKDVTINYMNGKKRVGGKTISHKHIDTVFNASQAVSLPKGYKLADKDVTVTVSDHKQNINVDVVPDSQPNNNNNNQPNNNNNNNIPNNSNNNGDNVVPNNNGGNITPTNNNGNNNYIPNVPVPNNVPGWSDNDSWNVPVDIPSYPSNVLPIDNGPVAPRNPVNNDNDSLVQAIVNSAEASGQMPAGYTPGQYNYASNPSGVDPAAYYHVNPAVPAGYNNGSENGYLPNGYVPKGHYNPSPSRNIEGMHYDPNYMPIPGYNYNQDGNVKDYNYTPDFDGDTSALHQANYMSVKDFSDNATARHHKSHKARKRAWHKAWIAEFNKGFRDATKDRCRCGGRPVYKRIRKHYVKKAKRHLSKRYLAGYRAAMKAQLH